MAAATAPSRWLLCWVFRGGENPFIYLFIYLNFLKYNINIRLSAAPQPVLAAAGRAALSSPARAARPQPAEVPGGLQELDLPAVSMAPEDVLFLLQLKIKKYIYSSGNPEREKGPRGKRSRAAEQRPARRAALRAALPPATERAPGASSAAKPAPGPLAPARSRLQISPARAPGAVASLPRRLTLPAPPLA